MHSAAYAHFYFYATRGMGSEGMGAGVVQGGVFGVCVCVCFLLEDARVGDGWECRQR